MCDCRYSERLPKKVVRFFAFLDPCHTELPPIFAATVTLTFAPSPLGETTAVCPPRSQSGLANWAKAAAVRAVKTAAQAALAAVPANAATIGAVDWSLVAGIAALPEVDSVASVRQMAGK